MMEVKSNFKMTDIGKLPFDWEVKKIEDITNILDSRRKPLNKEEREKRKGIIPYFGANGKVDSIDDYIFDQPLILLAEDGGYFDEYEHRPIAYKVEGKSWVNNHAHVLEPKKSESFNWIYYSLVHKNILSYINSGTRAKLNQADLRRIKIAFPPLKEQQKIAAILSTVDEQLEQTNQLIEKTKELKKGLMQQLLTKGIGHTEFKQTELGEIPVEWEVIQIKDLIESGLILKHSDGNHGSLYPKANEFIAEGIPYISANSLKNGIVDLKMAKYLSVERASKFKKGVAINNDVLFAHNATVGPVGILKTKKDYVILSTSLTLFRCNPDYIKPIYLSNYLSSPVFKKQYEKVMGQTTRNQVPITTQKELYAIIPSIQEQQKIAEILSSIDEDIEGYKEEKAKYEELKKGLMQQLLTGKKRVKV